MVVWGWQPPESILSDAGARWAEVNLRPDMTVALLMLYGIGAATFLCNRYVALGAALLAPLAVNMAMYHLFVNRILIPGGLIAALFCAFVDAPAHAGTHLRIGVTPGPGQWHRVLGRLPVPARALCVPAEFSHGRLFAYGRIAGFDPVAGHYFLGAHRAAAPGALQLGSADLYDLSRSLDSIKKSHNSRRGPLPATFQR